MIIGMTLSSCAYVKIGRRRELRREGGEEGEGENKKEGGEGRGLPYGQAHAVPSRLSPSWAGNILFSKNLSLSMV